MAISFKSTELDNLAVTYNEEQQIKLIVNEVSGTHISLSYTTLAGNNPAANANTVFLWQSDVGAIPWNQTAIGKGVIDTSSQSGSMTIENLQIGNLAYILGYATGPEIKNIAATAFIPASGSDYKYFASQLSITSVGSNSVSFRFETPDNYTPKSFKAWVGIWDKPYVPIPGTGFIKKFDIQTDANSGTGSINNLTLLRGSKYSLGLFFGEKETTLGATCSFTN